MRPLTNLLEIQQKCSVSRKEVLQTQDFELKITDILDDKYVIPDFYTGITL